MRDGGAGLQEDTAGTGNDFSCDIKNKMGKRHTGDTGTLLK